MSIIVNRTELDFYLNKIKKISLLSSTEFLEYFEKFKKGDINARDILWTRNLELVLKAIVQIYGVQIFKTNPFFVSDLIAKGNTLLLETLEKFDSSL